MSAFTSLTLKQLASGVVVKDDLPIKDLPNPLKRELEALARPEGNYTIIGESKELGKCGGGNLSPGRSLSGSMAGFRRGEGNGHHG